MKLKDLKTVWNLYKMVTIYEFRDGVFENLWVGFLDDLTDNTILNKNVKGIYENRNSLEIEVD